MVGGRWSVVGGRWLVGGGGGADVVVAAQLQEIMEAEPAPSCWLACASRYHHRRRPDLPLLRKADQNRFRGAL
uniref:Uncharacterized protein n=1 Tax=Marseillevirus LCMAC202 TaxID=2506606 RepID=A0A481YYZ9_9VIRU|nr:MAG: hypothetical protein LCMAC202_05720 [Marseillevirus LCMAC202]